MKIINLTKEYADIYPFLVKRKITKVCMYDHDDDDNNK